MSDTLVDIFRVVSLAVQGVLCGFLLAICLELRRKL